MTGMLADFQLLSYNISLFVPLIPIVKAYPATIPSLTEGHRIRGFKH